MAASPPMPPFLPESEEQFIEHVSANPQVWYRYCQQAYQAFDRYESEIAIQTNRLRDYESKIQDLQQIIDQKEKEVYKHGIASTCQKETFDRTFALFQSKISQLEAEKIAALNSAAPNVHTPDSSEKLDAKAKSTPAHVLRTNSPPPSGSSQTSYNVTRIPDPKEFDGTRSDFRRFKTMIYGKLKSQTDYFPDPQSRMRYVVSRLTGKAFDLIVPYSNNGDFSLSDYSDIIDMLERAFGDADTARLARNKLYSLKQRNMEFSAFFSEFQRLAIEGRVPEGNLYHTLEQSVSAELSEMMLHNPPPSEDYHELVRHLQELESRHRQHQFRRQQASIKTYRPATVNSTTRIEPTPRALSPTTPYTQTTTKVISEPMDLSNTRRRPDKETGNCFRCHQPGHRIRDCQQPDTRPQSVQRRDSETRRYRMSLMNARSPSPLQSPRSRFSVLQPTPVRAPTPAFTPHQIVESENGVRLG
jgi:hypothetical protein